MDKIELKEMLFYGYHGVLPEETKLGQRFIVDLSLSLDLSVAGNSDDLHDTVNYAEVYNLCKQVVEGTPRKLVETVAEDVCQQILSSFSKVQECTIKLIKPDPPIPGYYKSVSVALTRSRG
ncbi:dihydroneopterin aldolase [Bacillus pinisoli]|uniref:dihydroneopterin aldolase n=1 Tax=Bacillus pinisoli TaxID=2901866 RepID=UPI001FF61AA3|nr:dihydroneopterin aldolase [Bacillus pinisoli]